MFEHYPTLQTKGLKGLQTQLFYDTVKWKNSYINNDTFVFNTNKYYNEFYVEAISELVILKLYAQIDFLIY